MNISNENIIFPCLAVISIMVTASHIFGYTRQNIAPPEDQTKIKLANYLDSYGEIERLRFAKCARREASEYEKSQKVDFYINCTIDRPASAEKISFSVAFGARGQVEFWDGSKGEE